MVGARLRAKFRRRTTRHLGKDRPQTKQTLKYLVDDTSIMFFIVVIARFINVKNCNL